MKKILLVADQPGWIFDRHCTEIMSRLNHKYSIATTYRKSNIPKMSEEFDLVYILDPIPLRHGYPPQEKTIMGLRNEFLYREHPNGAEGLYEKGFPGRCTSIKDKCCILHVVNQNLMNIFADIVDKPLLMVGHGVDENTFNRENYSKEPSEVLRVSTSGRGSPNKGFKFVEEACEDLGLKFVTAQYGKTKRTKDQMPEFYNGSDVHVCMSKTEGLNNPLIEAGAMGLAVVSTRCGAAVEMIEDGVSGFLVDRDVESLKVALVKLQDDSVRKKMSELYHNEIMDNWTWKSKIYEYEEMFDLFFEMKENESEKD